MNLPRNVLAVGAATRAATLLLPMIALLGCGTPEPQPTAPSAPRNVTAAAGNTTATVSWVQPADDGGRPVTGYRLTGTGGISLDVAASDRSIVVRSLANGTAYTFSVAARNALGLSPAASAAPVTPVAPPGVPGAPTAVVAYAGDASATVNWSAPADQGFSAVLSYRVVASPGGASAQVNAPSTTTVVTGLTNGTAYTFVVTATNAAGEGAPSLPSAGVTPSAAAAVSRLPYKGVPASSSYTRTISQVAGGSLDSTAASLAGSGHVLTCAVYNTAGYTLVGIKPSISSASYTSQVNQVAGGSLDSTVASMGAGGFLVTAMVYNTAGYTLFGTKLSGATTYSTRVDQVAGGSLDSTISANAAAGYVTTAMEYNTAGYTLISVKENGGSQTWSSQVQQVAGGSLDSTVSSMASSGYAVTAMVYNTAGYTLVGMKQTGAQTATGGVVDQVAGSGLDSAVLGRGNAGYVTLAMYYNTAGYTFTSNK